MTSQFFPDVWVEICDFCSKDLEVKSPFFVGFFYPKYHCMIEMIPGTHCYI